MNITQINDNILDNSQEAHNSAAFFAVGQGLRRVQFNHALRGGMPEDDKAFRTAIEAVDAWEATSPSRGWKRERSAALLALRALLEHMQDRLDTLSWNWLCMAVAIAEAVQTADDCGFGD